MNNQNIFIINFNSLYEVLDEIKENLSFNILNFKSENDFIKDNHLDLKNSLIILKFNQKFLFNESLKKKPVLFGGFSFIT